jgi:hypothetical protein
MIQLHYQGQTVQGTLDNVSHIPCHTKDPAHCEASYHFEAEGKTWHGTARMSDSWQGQPGTPITIRYVPSDPRKSEVESNQPSEVVFLASLIGIAICFSLMPLGAAVVGLLALRWWRRQRRLRHGIVLAAEFVAARKWLDSRVMWQMEVEYCFLSPMGTTISGKAFVSSSRDAVLPEVGQAGRVVYVDDSLYAIL